MILEMKGIKGMGRVQCNKNEGFYSGHPQNTKPGGQHGNEDCPVHALGPAAQLAWQLVEYAENRGL